MKDLVAMRHKYWLGKKSLWPAKKSTVAVRFCWEGFKINRYYFEDAQSYAKAGFWLSANYILTGAYAGDDRNERFWNQFI